MKKNIHPKSNPVVFLDSSSHTEFVTTSTLTSDKTRDIDGVAHFVIPIEISSASHPFFTGKQILVDTARRVEKFKEKMEKTAKASGERKGKKAKRVARAKKQVDGEAEKKKPEEVKAEETK